MKKLTKKLTAILIIIIIALSPEFSLMVFADSYTGESTPCNTISYLNSSGYHIGGANVNNGPTPDYYLQYRTYTASEGSANAKVYNETAPTNINGIPNSNNQYWYFWDCQVNVSEHGNQYGNYTTDIYRILNNGTSIYYTTATTYVSPINLKYTYSITSSSSIQITVTGSDALNSSITTIRSSKNFNEPISYFDSNSEAYTSFAKTSTNTWTTTIPSSGQYTLYAKDENGYKYVCNISIYAADANANIDVVGASSQASVSPLVKVYSWSIEDAMNPLSTGYGTELQQKKQITDLTAPYQNAPVIQYTWPQNSDAHEANAVTWGLDFNTGDYVFVSYYCKTTDTTHSAWCGGGSFYTPSWQHIPQSTIDTYNSFVADGNWHLSYGLYKINLNSPDTILNTFDVSGTGITNFEINDFHCVKIPAGANLSDALQSVKWGYGQLNKSYFDSGNGSAVMNNTFNVNQNGYVTGWSKAVNGSEDISSYNITNYNPYAGDTTPPAGSYNLSTTAWTTGNVTINVTAADSQSGVKSITEPDGTTVAGPTCSYKVSGNGTYNFVLTDNAGNTCTYPVTVANIDRSVSVSYTSSVAYTVDPDNTGSPFSAEDITLTNNNTHVGAQVTLHRLTSALSGTNGFVLGAQVEESASGDTTWSEIDNKSVQLASGASTVLGVLSPGGTGHIKLVGQLGSLRWPSAAADTGNMQLTFTAVS